MYVLVIIYIFKKLILLQEITKYFSSNTILTLPLETFNCLLTLPVEESNVPQEPDVTDLIQNQYLHEDMNQYYVLVPQALPYEGATKYCKLLNGSLASVQDEDVLVHLLLAMGEPIQDRECSSWNIPLDLLFCNCYSGLFFWNCSCWIVLLNCSSGIVTNIKLYIVCTFCYLIQYNIS